MIRLTTLRLAALCVSAVVSLLVPSLGQAQSAYSCTGLDSQQKTAAIEGSAGIFYRVEPDMRMFNPFSDQTADQMAALSQALSKLGTTLIYVPVPTKSLAMPDQLPQAARDYGFDVNIATTVYLEGIKKLSKRGVLAVDARLSLQAPLTDGPSFFPTDYRMTSAGAAREAKAIADVITTAPGYAELPKGRFDTSPAGKVAINSPMRSVLQRHCLLPLPPAETDAYSSNRVQGSGVARDTSIFGSSGGGTRVAIVGTEIDGDPVANLAGFVAKATGLETSQYAVPGGGGFAAISSYLTSSAFQDSRPAFLIWANPVSENLASFGDQPFAELIAAAGDNCRVPLPVMVNLQTNSVVADLTALDAGQSYTLFVDANGAPAAQAQFDFTASNGLVRTKSVFRNKDQVKTGRFYMPMTGLWPEGAQSVEITLDVPLGNAPRVLACFN